MIKVITPPAAYPITRAEAKEFARIDSQDTSQDATIDMIIAAMTNYAEHLTGRAFVERTLQLNLDYFGGCIELPWAPLIAVDSVKYTDSNDAEATVSASDYEVDTVAEPGLVRPTWGAYWPTIGHGFNRVRIQYRAGYQSVGSPITTDTTYLPAELRAWIAARITTLYDNREHVIVGASVAEIPRAFVDGLLDPLIVGSRLF